MEQEVITVREGEKENENYAKKKNNKDCKAHFCPTLLVIILNVNTQNI